MYRYVYDIKDESWRADHLGPLRAIAYRSNHMYTKVLFTRASTVIGCAALDICYVRAYINQTELICSTAAVALCVSLAAVQDLQHLTRNDV